MSEAFVPVYLDLQDHVWRAVAPNGFIREFFTLDGEAGLLKYIERRFSNADREKLGAVRLLLLGHD